MVLPPGRYAIAVSGFDENSGGFYCLAYSLAPPRRFIRSDCDGDGFVGGSVNDAVFYLNWAFSGGPVPRCKAA